MFNKCFDSYYGEYKKSGVFRKKYKVRIYLYKEHIEGEAFALYDDGLSKETYDFNISFENINSIYQEAIDGTQGIFIRYKSESIITNSYAIIVLLGLDDNAKWDKLLNERFKTFVTEREQKKSLEKQKEEKKRLEALEREENALAFYNKCYKFHIKETTPIYKLLTDKNKIALIYINEEKSLVFLKVDGYAEEENIGIINYRDIHYYEKAGSISYVSDINAHYSSYGGSVTGSNFSKLAAVGGGFLFGLMGMAIGTAITYHPAQYTPPQTDINVDTEIQKIDDRNVLLNFYSASKKQYIDIELPQDIYNFLQTYLPEKKYGIVNELEKKAVMNQSSTLIENGSVLRGAAIPDNKNISLPNSTVSIEEFKIKVEKLKLMKDYGILSDTEFEEEKKKLLSQI